MRLPLSDPHIQLQLVADLNLLASFLAADDFGGLQPDPASLERTLGSPLAGVLVLLGNSVLHTSEHAFAAFKARVARHLLISGGRGHSTHLLYENLHADTLYRAINTDARSEADLLAEVAIRFHDIDRTLVTIETESSNCGENALLARRTLEQSGVPGATILLVQDPTMQRRSAASFAKAWHDLGCSVTIANYPTFVPRVKLENNSLVFSNGHIKGLWPMERFVSLVLGEIPRLRDDANGYGPKGRAFIEHVEISPNLLEAHERLAACFPTLLR